MKTKRGLKMLALGVTTGLVLSVAAPAAVVLGGTADVTGTGNVTESGGLFNGNVIGTLGSSSTDISVEAKVSGGEIVYNLAMNWGDMKFEYSYGSVWNPSSHTYDDGPSAAGWVAGVDGTNNKITVVNNSNFPMKADFSSSITPSVLNADPLANGSVAGIFAEDNAAFTPALLGQGYNSSDPASAPYTKSVTLEMLTANLPDGTVYYYKDNATGTNEKNIYFALSGTPDVGSTTTQSTPAGAINVEISPAEGALKATK